MTNEIPASHAEILTKNGLAAVATIGPDGAPHCSPVWFDYDGETIRFTMTEDRQKYRNLSRDNRVALSFVDPDNVVHSMEIRGRVTFAPDPDNAFVNELSNRYLGIPYPLQDSAPRVIASVTIDRVLTWM